MCPIACTAGMIKVMKLHGDSFMRDQWMKPLLGKDYDKAYVASQFLTEIQGGSDVGANQVEAIKDGHGIWRISGEKWFCSVANAELFFVTARVPVSN